MAKFIKETYKKENGELVKYPLGADIKNVVITKVDENGNEIIKNTLDKELEIVKQDSSSAAYPSYSIENIEEEGLEKLTKGESISSSIRKLYKVTSRFINHLKNITSGENHIPTGGKEGDILLWDSDGQAKWGPDENTTYSNFQGATANDPGKAGLVLAPAAGEQNKFLKGDGTWGSPDNAQYTPGIGISILNNQIGLATATITNTNDTDTSGTEMTIPYLTFDEYGRVKNIGTRKHTLPNSTFVGGTLTETLYYGSDKNYSTNTSGISTLSKLMLKVDSGYTGIDLTSGTDNYNIGIEDNILQFKKDETTAYQIDTSGNNIFNTSVSVTGLKSTDGADKVIIAEAGTGKLKTSSSITATELGYLDGVTSNIQTQLSAKVNKAGDTMTGALKFGSDSYYISSLGNATFNTVTTEGNAKFKGNVFFSDDGIYSVYNKSLYAKTSCMDTAYYIREADKDDGSKGDVKTAVAMLPSYDSNNNLTLYNYYLATSETSVNNQVNIGNSNKTSKINMYGPTSFNKGCLRIDITSQTLNLNNFNLSSGSSHTVQYVCKTAGGAGNISNIPIANQPFILDVELIRWASTTDYISRQILTSIGNKQVEYIRYCTNGTWEGWKRRFATVNESYLSAGSSDTTIASNNTDTQLQTLTLTPGYWVILAGVKITFSGNYNYRTALIGIHTSKKINEYPPGFSKLPDFTKGTNIDNSYPSGTVQTLNCQLVTNVTENTEIYLMGKVVQSGGGGSTDGTVMKSRLIAFRIPYV